MENRAWSLMSKIAALLLAVLIGSFAGLASAPAAFATNATEPGYMDELFGSDEGGESQSSNGLGSHAAPWGSDLFGEVSGYNAPDSDGGGIVDSFQKIVYRFGAWFVALGILFAVSRLVGRALLEMTMRQNGSDIEALPGFFKTGAERKGKVSTEWVVPMIKETFIYLGIAIFVFIILSVLASFVLWGLNSVTADAPI